MTGTCESLKLIDGIPCKKTAKWLVQVGTRKTDAQLCCASHLSQTCRAMYEAEDRHGATLIVMVVTS